MEVSYLGKDTCTQRYMLGAWAYCPRCPAIIGAEISNITRTILAAANQFRGVEVRHPLSAKTIMQSRPRRACLIPSPTVPCATPFVADFFLVLTLPNGLPYGMAHWAYNDSGLGVYNRNLGLMVWTME